jgi:mannose-6-phosphate isomerase-like protein (cupin superfamily)
METTIILTWRLNNMKLQGKVWGNTKFIFGNNNFEIHRIEVDSGGHCSLHRHEHKYNAFYLESGKLKIIIEQQDYDLKDETVMKKDDLTIVKPGLYHSFEALEDTVCYEIYWSELDHDDIQRKNVGGMFK